MHIHKLETANYKRIKVATVTFPENGTVEFSGANGAGKSSLLDSIYSALGGAGASPDRPIRDGARTAYAELDLGDLKVRRDWDTRGSRLTVTDAAGHRQGSPQRLLDGLLSRLAFDPLVFARMTSTERAAALRKVAGLDFADLDRRREDAYRERTEVNRAVKHAEAAIAGIPEVEPAEEISVAELNRELKEAAERNKKADGFRRQVQRQEDFLTSIELEIADLERRLARARDRETEATSDLEAFRASLSEEVDTAPILARIAEADAVNRRARQSRERQAALEQLRMVREQAEDLTLEIESVDAERARMLAQARFPAEGLGLDEGGVTLGGVPFDQASTAEQIRASLAVAAAGDAKLRLIRIREGSLLDDASLRLIAKWAEEHDYQVLVERVADSTLGYGVVIEEGLVKDVAAREVVSHAGGRDSRLRL